MITRITRNPRSGQAGQFFFSRVFFVFFWSGPAPGPGAGLPEPGPAKTPSKKIDSFLETWGARGILILARIRLKQVPNKNDFYYYGAQPFRKFSAE